VEQTGKNETDTERVAYGVVVDATNMPDVVRGFDALGRENIQGQVTAEWMGDTTTVRLQLGAQTTDRRDHQVLVIDGSYVAQRVGNAAIYAGYMNHWWGPGWNSAMSLSTDARPFPQVGLMRLDTAPFSSSWLSWIGPWQAEFFIGWLDGKRVARNTLLDGLRFNFSPLPGLEIGLARLDELCGKGHPCKPLATYFDLRNDPSHGSRTNDEANIDVRYTGSLWDHMFSVYMQLMNEDTNPIVHSGTSHLFGLTTWVPVGATQIRLTAEYADSIATRNIFSFGEDLYGFSYHDLKYPGDGMRYRDRTLGFSLDTDSRLATLQASWIGPHDIVYTATYHHASIGSPRVPGIDPVDGSPDNVVTSSPVTINLAEVRVRIPFEHADFDLAARIQDDQPRPDHGFAAAIESQLRIRL
jgi:hypothetical protein